MSERAQRMMQRALAEARRGLGRTHPNPAVGCVIARGDEIIAVGHHARAGGPHAEIVALKRAGERAKGADVYVTLEPCNHHGRTGPCTEALLAAGVGNVIAGTRDPNPIVDGRGLERLKRAGVAVSSGVEREACRELNEAYEHRMRSGRPFVVAKLAMSLDGKVATRTGASQWITGEAARRYGQRLRNELDAILVGVDTVLADDPRLSCRLRGGRDPVRIVLDTQARTPPSAAVVGLAARSKAPTWIVVGEDAPTRRVRALERAGAIVPRLPLTDGRIDLSALLGIVDDAGLLSVLVEGGPTVLGAFVDAGLVDKVYAFVAPLLIGGVQAKSAVAGRGAAQLTGALSLERVAHERVGDDVLIVGYPRR